LIMSLIAANHLSKSYGPDDIFSGVSLSVPRGGRVAIVGPNGIGKTTLLRILAGEDQATSGEVQRARNLKLGYLPQKASFTSDQTLWDECLTVFEDLRNIEAELARLEQAMSDPNQAEAALSRYGPLQMEFEHKGGYTYTTRIRQVLSGLGFDPEEYEIPLAHLSGGQRTRALLARLLLADTELLILDEPSNALDMEAVEWLEGYLNQWKGAALIVSHDRYFLDKVADTILEMSRGRLETYRGNYSAYLQQRQARWELRHQLFVSEKERMEKELDYVRRNISGQRTMQAKGKLRRLSRQIEAIEGVGIDGIQGKAWGEISEEAGISAHTMGVEEATRRLRALREDRARPPELNLNLKAEKRSGNIILKTQGLKIGYPGNELFEAEDIELRRLECAALIGPNGAGKTTFLKTILGKTPPLEGEVILGASLDIGYFAQAHEDLRPEKTLVEEIDSVAPNMLLAEIRSYLARFLFGGDDVFKKVSVLSGGERGRLALAKLSLSNSNLLLLDEPTNHLDIPAQEILQEVLANFEGTILLVSHDRYLIDALGTQIWEIDEERGRLRVFRGGYSEFAEMRQAEKEAGKDAHKAASEERGRGGQKGRGGDRPKGEEKRRLVRLGEVEQAILSLEEELGQLSDQLENPPAELERVEWLGKEYVRVQAELERLMEEWERLEAERGIIKSP
jgi:ATP-binding cassette, subfamily F, member 3